MKTRYKTQKAERCEIAYSDALGVAWPNGWLYKKTKATGAAAAAH